MTIGKPLEMIMMMRGFSKIKMQRFNLKYKILFSSLIFLATPLLSLAEGSLASTTLSKSDVRREEVKKQLDNTIDISNALINKMQTLAKRVENREAILVSLGSLSNESKEKIDLKLRDVDMTLASTSDKVNKNLPKLVETLLGKHKPPRAMKDFRREVNKIRSELISAHKMILETIDLIKKELIGPDSKTGKSDKEKEKIDDENDETATSSDQSNSN